MRKFLVGYDYGSGGIWRVIIAENSKQILEEYPELVIQDNKPSWMSEDMYRKLLSEAINLSDTNNVFFNSIRSQRA
ncbi:hypothetical protein [Agaribacter flavus]|uniref:Uncharacterized protein n=1 Tax=Agaribacter flavus TaxID=1902781 RepID=A0ABV7FP16_9ALTE